MSTEPLYLASSNAGKLGEFRALAQACGVRGSIELELLPRFDSLPRFEENAQTFAENAAGKAVYYSHLHDGLVLADDSGLVAAALGGRPGVQSARYAGAQASAAERNCKLIGELRGKSGEDRAALGKTFAEISASEKNAHSHRGKAFRKLLDFLATVEST